MKVQRVTSYSPKFTAKEQQFKQIGSKLTPIHKITATPASEPPKTFGGKLGNGIKYVIDRLYYYCFCAK